MKTIVIGAGIVGVCCALHLRLKGHDVVLIDEHEPGTSTSFGNAGVLCGYADSPLATPGIWQQLPKLALNLNPGFRIDYASLFNYSPWIVQFIKSASQGGYKRLTKDLSQLTQASLAEHQQLINLCHAHSLIQKQGWFKAFRHEKSLHVMDAMTNLYDEYNSQYEVLEPDQFNEIEPAYESIYKKILWIKDVWTVKNPINLSQCYFDYFAKNQGQFVKAKVLEISKKQSWEVTIDASNQVIDGDRVVVACGAWSAKLLSQLGVKVPLRWERGYHQMFDYQSQQPTQTLYDMDGCFVMAPMQEGIRLTSGIEWASLDRKETPIQIKAVEKSAREALSFGSPQTADPWMGRRPTLPDSLPIISEIPKFKGLWACFGHQHLGLTLAPISARLIAESIHGEKPFIDIAPYSIKRFL